MDVFVRVCMAAGLLIVVSYWFWVFSGRGPGATQRRSTDRMWLIAIPLIAFGAVLGLFTGSPGYSGFVLGISALNGWTLERLQARAPQMGSETR